MKHYDDLTLQKQSAFHLHAASKIVQKKYAEALAPIGISFDQLTMLMILFDYPKISLTDIALNLYMEKEEAKAGLSELAAKGYVELAEGYYEDGDLLVILTKKGEEFEDVCYNAIKNVPMLPGVFPMDCMELTRICYQVLDCEMGRG